MPMLRVTVSREDGQGSLNFNLSSMASLQRMREEANCEDDEYLWIDEVILDGEEKYQEYVAQWMEQGGEVSLAAGPIGQEPME